MSNILIAIWFILFGVIGLVATKIPEWALPVGALVAGLAVLGGSLKSSR